MTTKHPRAEVYPDAAGQFRFRIVAANGENLTPESYTRRFDAHRGLGDLIAAITADDFKVVNLDVAPDDAVVMGDEGITAREAREVSEAVAAGASGDQVSDIIMRQVRARHGDGES